MLYNNPMDTFSALADRTRRKILELLARDGPISATEIAKQFALTPPAISQHLKVLREAHLVHMDKRAQQRIYRINPDAIQEVEEWARRMNQLLTQRFDAFEKVLRAEKERIEQETKGKHDDKADDHD